MYKDRVTFYSNQNRTGHISLFLRSFFISCGAALVAISLQFFLMKNFVIDGGIVGIAILLSHIWSLKVGTLLFILNAPFLIIGSFYLGIRFLLLSLYAILVLATGTNVLEPYPALTDDPVLVILIGGFLLGLGVGVIIRFGGSLDGTEVIAILLSKRSGFSIGQFVMIMNIFIFGSSIFIFGLREFIYSLATFFIAYRTIDFSIQH